MITGALIVIIQALIMIIHALIVIIQALIMTLTGYMLSWADVVTIVHSSSRKSWIHISISTYSENS